MSEHNSNELEWFPSRRQDWVVQVVMLPAVYATMSLRCVFRCWELMTGSGWTQEMASKGWQWDDFRDRIMDEYAANFALANFAEMYALLCFSFLIVDLLKESINSSEFRRAFSALTMQGVLVFVAVGFAKTLCALFLTWVRALLREDSHVGPNTRVTFQIDFIKYHSLTMKALEDNTMSINQFLQYSLIITSLQALTNITLLCKLSPLEDINPSVKFLGIRILVILAQLQSFGLDVMSSHGYISLNAFQVKLLHASLMCIECVFVAMIHLITWPADDYVCGYLKLEDQDYEALQKRRAFFEEGNKWGRSTSSNIFQSFRPFGSPTTGNAGRRATIR
eukprot:TRINITY_DN81558_c0_g1_i1.p1 TRINITY_DN81558_c0_g1~~TRINITY_DN81558_c0_g1_i1.p1  ORF type:complete len:371 (+),score=38.18 TRINITY_DN81558_c0_g1_i1:107-1114(+)